MKEAKMKAPTIKKAEMKKKIFIILFLIALDQAIKLFISHWHMDNNFTIIPGIFQFRPVQNIHLGWIPSMLDFMMPVYFSVGIILLVMLVAIVMYRYLSYNSFFTKRCIRIPKIFLILMLSASVSRLIDDIFWGGSLDYIQLFNWFVFDLKDVYISSTVVLLVYYMIDYYIFYWSSLQKAERKEFDTKTGIRYWVKHGLPMKPKELAESAPDTTDE